jgi:hypothetical protein
MQILKSTDRVRVKIGEIAFILSPLKQAQKLALSGMTIVKDGVEIQDVANQISYIVKYCVKGVEGVTDARGDAITLSFDPDGALNDDSHSEVFVIVNKAKQHYQAMFQVAGNEIPKTIKDLVTGKEVKGAEVTVLPKT